ncbi:LacI family DNA-binding transcriptional regulator [Desemzia sp. RIT804]|uniref:LacI family DNA-binding transcriptional regulator n=1 Tax=Desemzia sp. RIT 804 TaxID=2810209 RepID=UPI0019501290|nr:LacI family DNA-binding transcriptional regulator [Desemzia sp. RIT 804]MBM6615564.1 LacI family DNA-binding transcriptional regulator [Desemzia sp. RIT 804]
MVTINDIAKKAGVAKSTVSRYLNGGSVSQKTKAKIERIVNETGYSPNTFAQSLKAKHTKMIGIIVPRLDSYSANEVLSSIDRKLRAKGYQLLITNTDQMIEREIENIYTLAKQKVAGIILMATVITEEHHKAIAEVDVPVLLLGQQAEGLHSIGHQEFEAGYAMGNYAGSLEHKNFLYFSVFKEDVAVGQLRANGVLSAFEKWPDIHVDILETSFSFQKAYELALEVLPKTKATYILCATDNIAMAVLKAAHTLNKNIPSDFSLSGFGGYEVTSIVSPSITTVKYGYKELGEVAVDQLFHLINREEVKNNVLISNTLIKRESTIPK